MFNEHKAAQIAAWFLTQEHGTMPHLKLIKLMYLAERESLRRHSFTMTGDRFYSLPQGPVLSLTLSHISDQVPSSPDGWDSWISDKENHRVSLKRQAGRESLDELSDDDIAVLEATWNEYGHMTKFQIRDFTHDKANCPEWKDPNGSRIGIDYSDVFEAVGFAPDDAETLSTRIKIQDKLARALTA